MKKNKIIALTLSAMLSVCALTPPTNALSPAIIARAESGYDESVSKITYTATATTVELLFDPAKTASSYRIYYYDNYKKHYVKCTYKLKKKKGQIQATVSKLDSDTEYNLKIVPVKNSIEGKPKAVNVRTKVPSVKDNNEELLNAMKPYLSEFKDPTSVKVVGDVYKVSNFTSRVPFVNWSTYDYRESNVTYSGYLMTISAKNSYGASSSSVYFLCNEHSSFTVGNCSIDGMYKLQNGFTEYDKSFKNGGFMIYIMTGNSEDSNDKSEFKRAVKSFNIDNASLNESIQDYLRSKGY